MSTFAEQLPSVAEREPEEARVARWRFDQFVSLGFSRDDALLLTVSRADLNTARRLVEKGCSPDLAREILL
jgi:hypothetical protein